MAAGKKLKPGFIECLDGMHGQSLAQFKNALNLSAASAEKVATQWYDEISKYDHAKPGPSPKARNFTQMVWMGSTSVGVALSTDGKFCVANYFPKGNGHQLDFPKNVLPVKKGAAPWEPHQPKAMKESPCSEENWERYEAVHAVLTENSRQRSMLLSKNIRPEDMIPSWPRPEEFFSDAQKEEPADEDAEEQAEEPEEA